MRILLVNYEYPPLGGGAGNATAHLAREMAALGAEVVVLTSSFRGLPRIEHVNGFTIRRVPVIRRRADRCTPPEMLTFLFSASAWALAIARSFRPEVTVAFFGIPSGPVSLALKIAYGIPYAISLRGGDVPGFQPYDLATYHKLLGGTIRSIWKRAAAVVANSDGLKDLVLSTAPDQPVQVIPNGVDIVRFRPRSPDRKRQGSSRIGFVGRLVRQKGLDVLLKAMAMLPPELDATLDVVGDGDGRAESEALASDLGIADRVRFLGWKTRSELPVLYRDMDLFVLPSRDEGMPNVVLEAMASGAPVVATRIAGNEELVQDEVTGLLVPPDDPAALRRALERILRDASLMSAMGSEGRRLVEDRYQWNRVAREYLALLQGCIDRAQPSASLGKPFS